VDCGEVAERLRGGGGLDDEAAAHAAGCPVCAELTADGGRLAGALRDLPAEEGLDLEAAWSGLGARLAAERGPRAWLASRPTWARFGLAAAVLLVVGVVNGLAMERPDLAVYPPARLALTCAAFGALALLGVALALRPLQRPPLRAGLAGAIAVGAGVAVPLGLAALPVAHADHPACASAEGAAFWLESSRCLVYGLVIGFGVLLGVALLDRSPRPLLGRATCLLAGAAGGLAANLALQLHCPVTGRAHLLASHATIGALVIGGYLLGRTVARRLAPR